MSTSASHVLYIDDSGTKEYANDPDEYDKSLRGNTRYFLFCGVLCTTVAAGNFKDQIVALKSQYFGTAEVEVKSNWLRNPKERQKRYLDAYPISQERLTDFVNQYYDLISKAEISFIAAVVDKKHAQEKYPNPYYAPAISYELLLHRVQLELGEPASLAVIIDDMTGKTPKGNQFKRNLISQHLSLKQRGGQVVRGFKFPMLSTQKFINSALSHLVQVADVAGYNVYRQFVDHGENWETSPPEKLPTYDHFMKIAHKFRQDENRRVQGYGIVKFPMLRRVPWALTKK